MNDKVLVEMTPLAQVDDGLYEVKLIQAVRGARRYDRNDLVMEFEIVQEQEQGVVLPAYYQVRWIDDASFTAGQKSHYFRDYQACIGRMTGKFFTLADFQDGQYQAKVQRVVRDAYGDTLAPLNQYSRVRRLLKSVDEY
jgi:hypothetical protein